MNDHFYSTRVLERPLVVERGMGPSWRDIAPPQSAFDAAARAFDLSYHEGRDELIAALQAAAPYVRQDEAQGAVEVLRPLLEALVDPEARAAVSEVLAALEERVQTLGTLAS